jgi:hypothetical protein
MAESELDHAQGILRNILTLLIDQLTPTLELAEVEGDAVFAYVPEEKLSRGELLLELIEAAYVAFRDTQRTMQHNATCPCKACQAIPTLDLKFVSHYGEYVLQNITGTNKPVGSCVNLVHRLLKNNVREETGWRGYALFSEESLARMGVCPEGLHAGIETYEHFGAIPTRSLDLDERYQNLVDERRIMLRPEEADVVIEHDFAAPLPLVWDWLNDPAKRTRWMEDSSWMVKDRPHGRTGPHAQNHCTTGNILEHVIDWRPFRYYTVSYKTRLLSMLITGELELMAGGVQVQWRMKLESPLPRLLFSAIRPFAVSWVRKRMEKGFQKIEQLMDDTSEIASLRSQ